MVDVGVAVTNTLYYGDNLGFLRDRSAFPDESVDLIYLDPPFNSQRNYNLIYRDRPGSPAQAQVTAFDDTWTWTDRSAEAYEDVLASGSKASGMLRALRGFLRQSDMMAYIAMMTVRLDQLQRVLRRKGALYLHCDPVASPYLRIVLDAIFGPENFRSEIVWRRSAAHNKLSRQYGPIHDTILFYAKSAETRLTLGSTPHLKGYVRRMFRDRDENGLFRMNELTGPETRNGASGLPWRGYDPTAHGRHWAIPAELSELLPPSEEGRRLSSQEKLEAIADTGRIVFSADDRPTYRQYASDGVKYQDLWAYQPGTEDVLFGTEKGIDHDVKWLDDGDERIGYPTQKPLGLLRRIILSSSAADSVVLDPFCGCGTTVEAAEELGRRWIGIDITHHAIDVIDGRLGKRKPKPTYDVEGRPEDLGAARRLWRDSPHQFQWWANWLVGVQSYRQRKGGDGGVDGVIYFRNGPYGTGQIIVSVKGGEQLNPGMVRDLDGTVNQEEAQLGLMVCLNDPTPGMRQTAAGYGIVNTAHGRFPKIQVVTIDRLLEGFPVPVPPPLETEAFRQVIRPQRRSRGAPSPQLSLALPIPGSGTRRKRHDSDEFYSGAIIAEATGNAP